jgi:hypothetical protein
VAGVTVLLGIGMAAIMATRTHLGHSYLAQLSERREVTQLSALSSKQLFALCFDGERHYRLQAREFGSSTPEWESAGVGDEAAQGEVISSLSGAAVYWVIGTQVQALQCSDGKTLWKASLAHDLALGASARAALVGSSLVVLERDGTIEAFSARSGQPVWHHRYLPGTDHLLVGSERILIPLDDKTWTLVQGSSGRQVTHFKLQAGRSSAGSEARWALAPDGKSAAVISGMIDPLAALVSLQQGKLGWCRLLSNDYPQPMGMEQAPQLEDNQLWWTQRHDLLALDLARGKVRRVYHSAEDGLTFLGASKGRVLLASRPDWDSSSWSLRCIAQGKQSWSYKVKGKSRLGEMGMSDWTVVVREDHLILLQVLTNPSHIAVDRIALSSGKSDSHQERTLEREYGGLSNVLVRGNWLATRSADRIFLVKLSDGTLH